MDTQSGPAERLISCIYEGILEPTLWSAGMEAIKKLTTSESATLTVWDRTINHGSIHESASLPEECRNEYNEHFTWVDPARTRIDGFAVGQWYIDQYHFGLDNIQHSEFYQDFMRRYDLGSVMICPLVRLDGMESFLSLERAIQQPLYDNSDSRVLIDVIPHLQRAIRIRSRMQLITRQAEIGACALDSMRLPLLIVDEKGSVLMCNAHAESLLGKQVVMQASGTHLAIPNALPGHLESYIKQACGSAGPAVANAMRVVSPKWNTVLQVIVMPLPVRSQLNLTWSRPLALVILYDPQLLRPTGQTLLQQLFSLTPAEIRVTAELLKGLSLQEAATQLNLGLSTVRSQLKSIFRKTGATRQAELIRMLSAMRILDLDE